MLVLKLIFIEDKASNTTLQQNMRNLNYLFLNLMKTSGFDLLPILSMFLQLGHKRNSFSSILSWSDRLPSSSRKISWGGIHTKSLWRTSIKSFLDLTELSALSLMLDLNDWTIRWWRSWGVLESTSFSIASLIIFILSRKSLLRSNAVDNATFLIVTCFKIATTLSTLYIKILT